MLEEVINRRRSIRRFRPEPVSQHEISQILWATQGLTDAPSGFRAIPSAGASYPLEIFVVCGRNCIGGVEEGTYRYLVDNHSLTLQRRGDVRLELSWAALDERFVRQAPLDIVICALYERTTRHYGQRGERYVHIEVGHAGQNIYLQATALGLATVAVGAFHDEVVRELLRLEKQYQPLYIMAVGKPA